MQQAREKAGVSLFIILKETWSWLLKFIYVLKEQTVSLAIVNSKYSSIGLQTAGRENVFVMHQTYSSKTSSCPRIWINIRMYKEFLQVTQKMTGDKLASAQSPKPQVWRTM